MEKNGESVSKIANRTQMTRIEQIFADNKKSARIRFIRLIRVLLVTLRRKKVLFQPTRYYIQPPKPFYRHISIIFALIKFNLNLIHDETFIF